MRLTQAAGCSGDVDDALEGEVALDVFGLWYEWHGPRRLVVVAAASGS